VTADSKHEPPSAPENSEPGGKKKSWHSRLWSVPGALGTLLVSGLISAGLAYYLPGIFKEASNPVAPITLTILDNLTPPFTMVVPQARTGSGSPGQACGDFRSWAMSRGGQDAGTTSFNLVVQGNTDSTVYIYGIRAHILSYMRPAAGTVVSCPTAGTVVPHPVKIDLDAARNGRYITSAARSPFGFTVSKSDLEVFQITATASRCDCRWDLQVKAVVAGQAENFVVTDHGKAFETTGYNPAAVQYVWNYSDGWDVKLGDRNVGQVPVGHRLPARPVRPSR
jgi:hypothetical protein